MALQGTLISLVVLAGFAVLFWAIHRIGIPRRQAATASALTIMAFSAVLIPMVIMDRLGPARLPTPIVGGQDADPAVNRHSRLTLTPMPDATPLPPPAAPTPD
jgi:hypothetical protein